mgnify:CR=1 FL=1
MALRDKGNPVIEVNAEQAMQQVKRRLNMLDERLDNMDSILTTLVERVMHQPVTLEVSCPKCGQVIQVNITSNIRLKA